MEINQEFNYFIYELSKKNYFIYEKMMHLIKKAKRKRGKKPRKRKERQSNQTQVAGFLHANVK